MGLGLYNFKQARKAEQPSFEIDAKVTTDGAHLMCIVGYTCSERDLLNLTVGSSADGQKTHMATNL